MERNPTEICRNKAKELHRDAKAHPNRAEISATKHLHCAFYNECLRDADKRDWGGFSCSLCTAYQALDIEQRVQDTIALLALEQASENEAEGGNAGRKRGVRPGADAKVRKREAIVRQIAARVFDALPMGPPEPRPDMEATGTEESEPAPRGTSSTTP